MLNRLQQGFFVTSSCMGLVSMTAIPAVWAETVSTELRPDVRGQKITDYSASPVTGHESGDEPKAQMTQDNGPIANHRPATPGKEWRAQLDASPVQITGVQLVPTPEGIEILLETPTGASTLVQSSQQGNRFIAEISNAQLALPTGDRFRQENPTEQIALVTVAPLDANRIQVVITGNQVAPTGQIFVRGQQGLILKVDATRVPTTTTPEPTPTAEEAEPIELIVTATRTEEDPLDIPRSVTVITREELEEQTATTRNLNDILGLLVPGFGPPNQLRATNTQTLRGRTPLVLIDGVPQNTNNRTFRQDLRNIDPAAIERIEVVRGPSAIYGDGGTGGVINIITRSPEEERLVFRTEIGINAALGELEGESFGNFLQQSISGREGQFDYVFNFARNDVGSFFDAEGKRIPPLGGLSAFDTTSLNVLGKVGFNFDGDRQRVELTVDHYRDEQNTDVISDVSVDATDELETARAIEVGELDFIGTKPPGSRNTLVNLSYSHKDLFNSEVQAQLYYRDNLARSVPFDEREFGFFGLLPAIDRTNLESEKWGGRLQIDTPLAETLSLLWGADYTSETTSEIIDLFDPETFDNSGRRVFEKIDEFTFAPKYDLNSLGLFAQLQWEATDRLRLSGGLRHERIGFAVDDYVTFFNQAVQGGNLDFDATLFSVGAVYDLTNELSVFTSFAQGFSVPEFSRILSFPPPEFVNVEDDFDLTEPQRVDNYEIGIRGNWDAVQVSLAAFYNWSDLGATFSGERNRFQLTRAPIRIYGVEATLDVQPSDRWQLGGTVSWTEGEFENEAGDFEPLSSRDIQPIKFTAYVQNVTLPGWRNRLQALIVGSRDRAAAAEVDNLGLDGYVVFDLISQIDVGPGVLQIGVENLFDEQYFTPTSQVLGSRVNSFRTSARGRTISVSYGFTW